MISLSAYSKKEENMLSVQFSHSFVSNALWPQGLQHSRLPCPSPTHGVYSNSCPLTQWCHPTISTSVTHFSSHLQSFPAFLQSFLTFPVSQFFTSVAWLQKYWHFSFSISPFNEYSGLISFRMDWLDLLAVQVFSNTTVQKHPFFGAQISLESNSHIHTWLLEKP